MPSSLAYMDCLLSQHQWRPPLQRLVLRGFCAAEPLVHRESKEHIEQLGPAQKCGFLARMAAENACRCMVAKESIRKKNTRGYGHDDTWQVPTQMLHDHKFRGMILSSPTAFFEQGDLPLPLFGFMLFGQLLLS